MASAPATYTSAVPVVSTGDVTSTLRWFEGKLGFTRQFVWGEPPVYAGVSAGRARIYITLDEAHAAAVRERSLAPDLFIWVEGIDTLYADHRARGVEIFEPLAARPWGVRQYVAVDPNGYHLKIAELIEPESSVP